MKLYLQNIKRIIDWLPILWNDRDYDYSFLLRILHYKLERMKKCIVSNQIIQDANKVGFEILMAQEMIDNNYKGFDDEWYEHYQSCPKQGDGCVDCAYLLKVADKEHKQNWHNLWKHFDEYMQGWWD